MQYFPANYAGYVMPDWGWGEKGQKEGYNWETSIDSAASDYDYQVLRLLAIVM